MASDRERIAELHADADRAIMKERHAVTADRVDRFGADHLAHRGAEAFADRAIERRDLRRPRRMRRQRGDEPPAQRIAQRSRRASDQAPSTIGVPRIDVDQRDVDAVERRSDHHADDAHAPTSSMTAS